MVDDIELLDEIEPPPVWESDHHPPSEGSPYATRALPERAPVADYRESPMSPKVVAVGPLDGFRIWVRFDDGTSGDIDLAHLAELPMYQAWHDPNVFATVRVSEYGHDITWYTPPVDLDLVAHWLYTEITGVTFSELMERPGRFTHWQINQWAKWFRLSRRLRRRLRRAHPEAAGGGLS